MRGGGSILPFLQQLGLAVELVREAQDARAAAVEFAARHGLDERATTELILEAFTAGHAASLDGRVACILMPEGVLMAHRDASLATTLHEVRNAITAVAGWARIAKQEGGATARADRALTAIESASLVAMEAASLDGGAPPKKARPLSVSPLIAQACELVEPMARERGVLVREAATPDLKVTLPRSDLFSALSNLLKNAVEASQSGDEVFVRSARVGSDIEVVVENARHGAALPAVGVSTKGEGRGLGLRLVSRIAHACGGSLVFTHDAPDKVCAHLRIPATVVERRSLRPEASGHVERVLRERTRAPAIASGMRPRVRAFDGRAEPSPNVLVVDDEIAIRDLVTTALELGGIRAVAAGSIDELAHGPRRTYELALVDLRLDDDDGLSVGRRLVAEGWAKQLVIMTGAPMGAKPEDVLAVIRKPFDLDELTRRITEWITPSSGRSLRSRRAR